MRGENQAQIVYIFGLSLLFVGIDMIAFTLLTKPLALYLLLEPIWLNNVFHLVIISLAGTCVGCFAFALISAHQDWIPKAYSFFPAYMLVGYAFGYFNTQGETQAFFFSLFTMYTLIPTLVGLGVSWGLYTALVCRKKTHERKN